LEVVRTLNPDRIHHGGGLRSPNVLVFDDFNNL